MSEDLKPASAGVLASAAEIPAVRRRERNPEKTRRKVLEAAKTEFAEKGLNGARIEAIARRAGSNVQAIYHYFNSKEELYSAVLENLYDDDWLFEGWDGLDDADPIKSIEILLKCIANKFLNDEEYGALLTDENTHKARHIKDIPRIHQFYERLIRELSAVLERGQAAGLFRKDVDAQLFYILAISAIGGSATGRYTMSEALVGELLDSSTAARWVERVSGILLRGLRPD